MNFPNSVTSIGDFAFYGCEDLESVSLPNSVTSISHNAFSYCPNPTITVERNSYAAQYCKKHHLTYTYPDSLDWLNN